MTSCRACPARKTWLETIVMEASAKVRHGPPEKYLGPFLIAGYQADFEDDPDLGFESHDKDIAKPRRKAYEVDYKVFGPMDIQSHQDKQIDEVSIILGQPPEASAILLRHFRWNKERLIESYMDRPEQILESAGLGQSGSSPAKTKIVPGFTCDICCDDDPGLETYAMKCGHRYCVDCYRQYLAQKIKEEGEAARIQCPKDGCSRIVDSKSLDLLVAEELKDRYVQRYPPNKGLY